MFMVFDEVSCGAHTSKVTFERDEGIVVSNVMVYPNQIDFIVTDEFTRMFHRLENILLDRGIESTDHIGETSVFRLQTTDNMYIWINSHRIPLMHRHMRIDKEMQVGMKIVDNEIMYNFNFSITTKVPIHQIDTLQLNTYIRLLSAIVVVNSVVEYCGDYIVRVQDIGDFHLYKFIHQHELKPGQKIRIYHKNATIYGYNLLEKG